MCIRILIETLISSRNDLFLHGRRYGSLELTIFSVARLSAKSEILQGVPRLRICFYATLFSYADFCNNNEARAPLTIHHVAVCLMVFVVSRCH